MRILIIADEVWNDHIFGNGVLTNWFTNFPAEFAEIYCSPGLPENSVCKRYFRLTDDEMVKSIIGKGKAGKVVELETPKSDQKMVAMHQGFYAKMKNLSTYVHTPMMMVRDLIWLYGRYNENGIKQFIDDFNPDIVFCPRLATPKLLRLERYIHQLTEAPVVAFTGDDEASFREFSWSPLYWLRRCYVRWMFDRVMPIYSHYFMHSPQQAAYYKKLYGVNTETLYKCGTLKEAIPKMTVNKPLVMVYAGRLYCNRWKTLAAIGEALGQINKEVEKIVLHVYTTDTLTNRQKVVLCEENSIYFKGSVTPSELTEIYKKADIALHVESFDRKYKYATRMSFSTKIIDLMGSGCSVMAICWEEQAGFHYLKKQDVAFCISSYAEIQPTLSKIVANPRMVCEYAKKAQECVIKNHSRKHIQQQLIERFQSLIENK